VPSAKARPAFKFRNRKTSPHRPTGVLACALEPGVVAPEIARAAGTNCSVGVSSFVTGLPASLLYSSFSLSIAKSYWAAAWQRPHSYVGSHGPAAPQ
jgi:hypothetical protein